jgi:hypothetical protein
MIHLEWSRTRNMSGYHLTSWLSGSVPRPVQPPTRRPLPLSVRSHASGLVHTLVRHYPLCVCIHLRGPQPGCYRFRATESHSCRCSPHRKGCSKLDVLQRSVCIESSHALGGAHSRMQNSFALALTNLQVCTWHPSNLDPCPFTQKAKSAPWTIRVEKQL